MADKDNMSATDKVTDEATSSFDKAERARAEDAQADNTNHKAVLEATRLGGGDTYLVESDLEDLDERVDGDGADGRPSPMANADNPER